MGHDSEKVWSYSPRQIAGYLFLASKRLKATSAEKLIMGTLAARGELKTVRKTIKEMQK